ncbi:unnamed protein product [Parnassius mnemosyne]|uniref:DUF5641 domain-containing protein n=1 Tax=Parnassius mnemosyne TaxID=213953 RepID=A0AAV1LLW8_9NEOP
MTEEMNKQSLRDSITRKTSAKGQITKFKNNLNSISCLMELNNVQLTELHLKLTKFEALSMKVDDLQSEVEQNENIEQLVSKFWELEEAPKKSIISEDESECERHFLANTIRDEEGADDPQQLIYIQKSVSNALKLGCFNLRKYKSNHPYVFDNLDINKQDSLTISESSSTLGLGWKPSSDTLHFPIRVTQEPDVPITKRFIMSNSFKIFDPLDVLSPVIIVPKMMLQRIWKENLEWNQPLPSEIKKEWTKFTDNLKFLSNLQILSEILEHASPLSWRYVPTDLNPADFISRGINAKNIMSLSLWWSGATFLLENEIKWPVLNAKESDPLPELKVHSAIINDNASPLSWKLGRVLRLITGSDGTARVADITTNKGCVRRSLVRLCNLPTAEELQG